MSCLFLFGVLECPCKGDRFHKQACPLRRYMGKDTGFRNEELFLKIGRFKIPSEQLVLNRWPWPQIQSMSGFEVNVFPPLKKDKSSGRCFVDVHLSTDGLSQISRITGIISSELDSPFVETKRFCIFHAVPLPLTHRLNKRFESFTLRLTRLEIFRAENSNFDPYSPKAPPEISIAMAAADVLTSRLQRQAALKQSGSEMRQVMKYFCCTLVALVLVLVLIPVIATEILNRQTAAQVEAETAQPTQPP